MGLYAALSTTQILQLVLLVPVGFLFLGAVYRRYFHPLAKYPGPFLASITRWWMVSEIFSGKHEQHIRALHKKYGNIVRIAPNEVAIADPQAIKSIYSTGGGFTKADWYTVWEMVEPDLFSLQDEKMHGARRRNVANAYALSTLLGMEEYVDQCSTLLLRQFEKFAKNKEIVDISPWLQYYAFDVVGELGFGKKFGFIEAGKDIGWIGMIEEILLYLTWTGQVPYMKKIMDKATKYLPLGQGLGSKLGEFAHFSGQCVEERMHAGAHAGRKDLLYYFTERQQKNPDIMRPLDVHIEANSAVFAGSDTTAIALRAIFYYLLKNPSCYAKIREELNHAENTHSFSESVTYAQARALPYFQAVVSEALRMCPSVALSMPRYPPKGGATICGEYFPETVQVGCNAHVIHFDKGIFGDDADVFNPERWLVSEARNKEMDKFLLTFGAGSRTCVGKNISLMEINKVVPQILRYFDLTLADQSKEWTTYNAWFIVQKDIKVYLTQRRAVDLHNVA